MLNKKLVIATLLLGLFSTGLMAKEADYEKASKPTITLKKADLDILAKAKEKNFKGLSTKEKESLLKFLDDYAKSAKKEKVAPKIDDKKGDPSKD